jgi:hypothetical protein
MKNVAATSGQSVSFTSVLEANPFEEGTAEKGVSGGVSGRGAVLNFCYWLLDRRALNGPKPVAHVRKAEYGASSAMQAEFAPYSALVRSLRDLVSSMSAV